MMGSDDKQWPGGADTPRAVAPGGGLPMQADTKQPRRVRVERGIYKNPGTGRFEIQYTDSSGKVRWQTVAGGLRDARFARAEIQARLGRGDLIVRGDRTLAEVGEEWLAQQHHLR